MPVPRPLTQAIGGEAAGAGVGVGYRVYRCAVGAQVYGGCGRITQLGATCLCV